MPYVPISNGPCSVSVQLGFLALKSNQTKPNHLFIIKSEPNYLKFMKPFKPNRLKNRRNHTVYGKFSTKPNRFIINQNQTKPNHFLLMLRIILIINLCEKIIINLFIILIINFVIILIINLVIILVINFVIILSYLIIINEKGDTTYNAYKI